MRRLSIIAVLAVLASACSRGADRGEVLEATAEASIVPTYQSFAADAAALDGVVDEFCAAPSADGVAAVAEATGAAHRSWATTETMWIGPVMDRRSWAVIDWPIAEAEIDELLADTTLELDVDRIGSRVGADQRGLGAIEYLIDVEMSAFDDPRRCDYLSSVSDVIVNEADLLVTDWTVDVDGTGPWSSTISAEPDVSVDALVNDAIFMLEATADAELGTALGEMDRDQDVDAILEGPLGFGVDDIAGRVAGLRVLLIGTSEAPGLSELLGDDLATRLGEQIDAAETAVAAIDGALSTAVIERPAEVSSARAAIKVVQVTLSTEVVSRLGVTIGFSDADGDTGG